LLVIVTGNSHWHFVIVTGNSHWYFVIVTFCIQDMVVTKAVANGSGKVDPALLLSVQIARDTVRNSIVACAPANGEQFKQICSEREATWLAFDRDLLLDAIYGQNAGLRLKQKLLDAMWTEALAKTPVDTLQILDKIMQTDEFKLCNEAHQGKCQSMHKIIGRLVDHRDPQVQHAANDDMLKDVVARIPFFWSMSSQAQPRHLDARCGVQQLCC
jgi:hypothetical protein